MNNDTVVREQLLAHLCGGNAHFTFEQAVAEFPLEHINSYPPVLLTEKADSLIEPTRGTLDRKWLRLFKRSAKTKTLGICSSPFVV